MNYGNIKSYDIADGTGVRVSLFVSGCRHHCKGCFNAPTWDFNYGKPFTRETQDKILELLAPSYIEGFSLLGGEPFEPENQPVLAELLEEIRRTFPDKSIWCYSGYLFDKDMVPGFSVNYVYRTLYNVTTEHNTPDSFLNFIILISVRIFLHNGILL